MLPPLGVQVKPVKQLATSPTQSQEAMPLQTAGKVTQACRQGPSASSPLSKQ
jgi:hypothetical protein